MKISVKNEGNAEKIHHQYNYTIGNVKPEGKLYHMEIYVSTPRYEELWKW